jgi:hypothetical protein
MGESIFRLPRPRSAILAPDVGRARFAAAVSVVICGLVCADAKADTALPDVLHAPGAGAQGKSGLAQKFAGSAIELSSYIGSGTFYDSGYRDPYVSLAVFARPTYELGTRYQLSLNARIYVELEMTQPDNPEGRHFYPYDPWIYLSAANLHTWERSKLRLGGVFRTILPLSYESRYQHLIFGTGVGLNLNRPFALGHAADPERQWKLTLTLASLAYKYFHSSDFRGTGPDDTSGCRAPPNTATGGATASGGEPSVSASDRCGGPANPSFSFQNGVVAALARGKWSLTTTLLLINTFSYAIPLDAYSSENAVARGRTDLTWGIIAVGYQIRPRIGLSAGLSSQQPALDSRYRYPRFPFYDFSGGASANNYSQLFVSLNGTL